jgi:Ca-activated chloride channel family protein
VVRNPTTNVQTADFEVRIPKQAFISKFQIEVNEEVFNGKVEEKKKAAEKFKNATKRGQSAGTVVQRGTSKFGTTVSVSNMCELTFRLTYEYVAERVKGKFNIPISVTPTLPVITRRLNISIEDPSGINCLEAENYKNAKFEFESKNMAKSTYELDRTELDDFVITYDLDQDSLIQNSGTTLYDSRGFVFVSYTLPQSMCYSEGYNPVCPARNARKRRQDSQQSFDSIPKCVSFVIDRSGSMFGSRIRLAKESLVLILKVLRSFDYATIISFAHDIRVDHTLAVVGTNLDALIRAANNIQASGATNINDALLRGVSSLRAAIADEVVCIHQLVFLTDGDPTAGITDPDSIIRNYARAVQRFEGDAGSTVYTYTLGFGTSLNFRLLQSLAIQNSGFARSINLNQNVASQLTEFYREIACPLLCGLTFKYDNESIVNVTRNQFSQCYFDGEQVVVGGRLNPESMSTNEEDILKSIALGGDGAKGTTEFASQLIKIEGDSSFVERAYAYLQIQNLLQLKAGASAEAKKELDGSILRMALEYQLVTPLTSMIVVKPCPIQNQPSNNMTNVTTPTTPPPTTSPTTMTTPTTKPTTRMDFDPHFVATTATGHRLCYTVDGRDGEVYNILADRGIVVNGEIISFRYKGTRKTYFGTIVVKFKPPDCTGDEVTFVIDADKGLAFLNSKKLIKWGEKLTYSHQYGIITSESKKQLQFVFSFPKYNIEIVVSRFVRKGAFLGLAVTDTSGLTRKTHGLIGQFVVMQTNVTVDDKKIHIRDTWYEVGPWQRLDPASGKYVPCYAVRPKGNVILEGEIPDYLMENLFSSDFEFSHYSKTCSK